MSEQVMCTTLRTSCEEGASAQARLLRGTCPSQSCFWRWRCSRAGPMLPESWLRSHALGLAPRVLWASPGDHWDPSLFYSHSWVSMGLGMARSDPGIGAGTPGALPGLKAASPSPFPLGPISPEDGVRSFQLTLRSWRSPTWRLP